jgi:hypothetical protein
MVRKLKVKIWSEKFRICYASNLVVVAGYNSNSLVLVGDSIESVVFYALDFGKFHFPCVSVVLGDVLWRKDDCVPSLCS